MSIATDNPKTTQPDLATVKQEAEVLTDPDGIMQVVITKDECFGLSANITLSWILLGLHEL